MCDNPSMRRDGRTLGAALEDEMGRRAHRQEDAARKLGVSQTTVSKWIRGAQIPDGSPLLRLMEYLSVDEEGLIALLTASYAERVDRVVWTVSSKAAAAAHKRRAHTSHSARS